MSNGTPSLSTRIWQRLSKAVSWLLCKLWFRLRCVGCENLPASGPVLLVANHASFLDPALVGVCVRRWVRFVARRSLARSRLVAFWMRHMQVVLVDRDAPTKQVLREIERALAGGDCIGLFPEGTRSRDGRVGPFRGGVGFLARRTGATVVPVGIDGSFRALPRNRWFPKPRSIVLRYGRPWPAAELLAPGGLERLRAEVARLAAAPLAGPPGAAGAFAGDKGEPEPRVGRQT